MYGGLLSLQFGIVVLCMLLALACNVIGGLACSILVLTDMIN